MSIREAKLELKARGLKDPARNPSYKTVAKETIPIKIRDVNEDHSLNRHLLNKPLQLDTTKNKEPSMSENKEINIDLQTSIVY